LIFGGGPASASGGGDGCNPAINDPPRGTSNYQTIYLAGMDHGYGTLNVPTLVGADIYNYSPFVSLDNGSHDGAYEWVMLDKAPDIDWVQIGWYEYPGSVRGVFDQAAADGKFAFTHIFGPPDAINSVTGYKVTYDPNGGGGEYFRMYWDSNGNDNQVDHWNTNAFTPNDAEVEAEIHTQSTQFPGAAQNDNAAQSGIVAVNDGSYTNFDGNTDNVPNPGWIEVIPAESETTSSYETWDKECTGQ
jgi:hypothetical protein